MSSIQIFNISGLQLKINPLLQKGGELLLGVNADCYLQGGKKKRPGYGTFLGTPDNNTVDYLYDFTVFGNTGAGTEQYLYRHAGTFTSDTPWFTHSTGTTYYSKGGTSAWATVSGISALQSMHTIGTVLYAATGNNPIAFTTNGTAFTIMSGTAYGAVPTCQYLEDYQGRLYAAGPDTDDFTHPSTLFYSSANVGTNWQITGTSDSSSIDIPGPGAINGLFKANDRLVITKDTGAMYYWDGYSLSDLSTNLGPTSYYSLGSIEDYRIYLNRQGIFAFNGQLPQIISNPIEKFFFNDLSTGIQGTAFNNIPGEVHYYDYFASVGPASDDLTRYQFNNLVLDYDYRFNEHKSYDFANKPTAFHSYKDTTGALKFIFGDASGQCYTYDPTYTSDNGKPIPLILMGFIHGNTLLEKKWRWFRALLNPGNEARVQVAISDSFTPRTLSWRDLGDCSDGVVTYRFPEGSRGKFLFWRISESSMDNRCEFLGVEFDAETIPR